jgi:hypothetical protein
VKIIDSLLRIDAQRYVSRGKRKILILNFDDLFHLLIILIRFSNILFSQYIILIYKLGEIATILITDSKNWRMNMKSEKKERNC